MLILRRPLFSFFLLMFLALPALKAQEVSKSLRIEKIDGKKYYIHTVAAGQTLFSIAKAYSLEVADVVKENPSASSGIKPGQELRIPLSQSVQNTFAASSQTRTYKVEAGQTLYSISRLYGITVDAIRAANPELKDGLKAGQVIKIPPGGTDVKENPSTINAEALKPKPPVKEETKISGTKEKEKEKEKIKNIELKENTNRVTELPSPGDTTFVLVKKDKYQVALFLPFHLENVDNVDVDRIARDLVSINPKTDMALQFYQGFRLGLDSIHKLGMNTELFVYDIDENDSAKVETILHKPEMGNMNLIVGPLSSASFQAVARFAKKKNIPIVSPLSQQNKILLNNDCVSKMTPSVTTQLEEEASFIFKTYNKENILLLTNSNPKEASYTHIFRTRFNELRGPSTVADSLHLVKGADGMIKALSLDKINVIVIPSNSQAYVTDMLRTLNTLLEKYRIIVFGMQSWSGFTNLDYEYLNKLQLHYASNSYVDYESDAALNFIKNYRILTSTEPGPYAFQGYDAGLYYLNALMNKGVNFRKKLDQIKWKGTQSSFDFYKTSPESGFENKAVNLLKIQDYKLIPAR
ncbi:MAG TPA: LysM peptidoglycan-binding domain-containing protein [Bacteroidia bacterium]|nr:LysM peptidoglycan-binding domain-containing protein [Bacteroidia bacterium]